MATEQPRAFLKDSYPIDSVPLESPALIAWTDPLTGESFRGYRVDIDALTVQELQEIYRDIKKRFPGAPCFDSWVEIVRMEGMPIREERVSSTAFDLRLVV